MPKSLEIIAAGLSPQAVNTIQGGTFSSGGLVATGSSKATSLLMPASDTYVSLCSSGKGIQLPICIQGDECRVYNGGLNACLVYTPVGTSETITNGSANQGFSVGSFKSAIFEKVTSTLWMVNLSA